MSRFIFRTLAVLLIAVGFCPLHAQKSPQYFVDSLLAERERPHTDAERLDILIGLINWYNDLDGQEGLTYEREALALATRLGSKHGEAEVLSVVGRIYWREGNFEQAFAYHDKARRIFEAVGDKPKVATSWRNIGQDYLMEKDHQAALESFKKALSIYEEIGDLAHQGAMHNFLAYTHSDMGNYAESSEYGFAGLEIYEKLNNRVGMAHMISGIAENSLFLGQYADALGKLKDATEIFMEDDDWINVGANYNVMGRVCRLMKDYPQALDYHRKALEYGRQASNLEMLGTSHLGLAEVHVDLGQLQEAVTDFLAAIDYYEQWSNLGRASETYVKLASAYRQMGEFTEARRYLDKAFARSEFMNNNNYVAGLYQEAELLDSALGRWKGAYENHRLYIAYRDSAFSQKTTERMVQLQQQYEFDKAQEASRREQERREKQQTMQIIFLVIIIALVVTIAVVQYRNKRTLASVNLDLKNKSESLEREMSEKSGILNVVTHDLKAPLAKIEGLTNVMEASLNGPTDEQRQVFNYIRASVAQGNGLIKNLLDAETMNAGSVQPSYATTDLSTFLADYHTGMGAQLATKRQTLNLETDLPDQEVLLDQALVTRVLDNLVSNASKFSEEDKSIYLRAWQANRRLHISVRDEGPGISKDDQKKLFRKFQMLTARPTKGESSAGLGLSIVKSIVEKLKGTIAVESEPGKGTEFVVSWPLEVD